MRKFIFTSFFAFLSLYLFSQREYGFEYQHGFGKSYNSNSLGASFENFSHGSSSWQIVAHYTWDIFTKGKNKQGISNFGLSLGYRYGFSYDINQNFFGGIRTTASFVTDKNHVKLTPSIEFGYHYTFNPSFDRGGFITPSVAFGYDIPIGKEKNEDYKGTLFIPRFAVGYHF